MRMRMMRRLMGVLLLLSMLVTTALLVVQGRWQEAIPLHLCSVSALLAAVLSFKKSPAILDFLWYLGMAGRGACAHLSRAGVQCNAAALYGGICRDACADCRYSAYRLRDGRRTAPGELRRRS